MSDVRRLTPLVSVDAIEPCIPFWTDILGFEQGASVPTADGLGFLILERGPAQLMYQTVASVKEDIPSVASQIAGQTQMLYAEVTELDEIVERLEAAATEVVVPRRTTFYGADEIFVRAPCGTIVGLAEFGTGDTESD